MTTFYVATLARYVRVDADDKSSARLAGHAVLHDLDLRLGRDVPIAIHTVRAATADEIEFWNWHCEMVVREAARAEP